jgi:hypothetical protein
MTRVQTVAAGPAPLAPRSLVAKRIGHMSRLGHRPLLSNKPHGVPRVDDRPVLNGIFWVLRSCQMPFADEK